MVLCENVFCNGGEFFFEFLGNHFHGHVDCWLLVELSSLEELDFSCWCLLRKTSLFHQFMNEKWCPTIPFLRSVLDESIICSIFRLLLSSEATPTESGFGSKWKKISCPPAGADRLKIFTPHRKEWLWDAQWLEIGLKGLICTVDK